MVTKGKLFSAHSVRIQPNYEIRAANRRERVDVFAKEAVATVQESSGLAHFHDTGSGSLAHFS